MVVCPFSPVDLGELVIDASKDVGEALHLAEPASLVGLLQLLDEALTGSLQARLGALVGSGQLALLARVLVHAVGAVGAHAVADGDLAFGEVLLEKVPLVGGDVAVLV